MPVIVGEDVVYAAVRAEGFDRLPEAVSEAFSGAAGEGGPRLVMRSRILPLGDLAGPGITRGFLVAVKGATASAVRELLGAYGVVYEGPGQFDAASTKAWNLHHAAEEVAHDCWDQDPLCN